MKIIDAIKKNVKPGSNWTYLELFNITDAKDFKKLDAEIDNFVINPKNHIAILTAVFYKNNAREFSFSEHPTKKNTYLVTNTKNSGKGAIFNIAYDKQNNVLTITDVNNKIRPTIFKLGITLNESKAISTKKEEPWVNSLIATITKDVKKLENNKELAKFLNEFIKKIK